MKTKKAPQQINRLNQEVTNLKGLISLIFHDLRNPLNAVMGFIELINRNYEKYNDEKKRELLDIANCSTKNLWILIQDLATLSGTLLSNDLQINQVRVGPEIENVINLLNLDAQKKGIKIINNTDANLSIMGDAAMLRVVLRNLISNAIKFSPQNSEINIRAEKLKNREKIIITDAGVGMDPKTLKQIFTNAVQSTPGTNQEKGTGLGLLICQKMIQKMRGKIWATSQEGQGSKFHFTLPSPPAKEKI